MAKKAKGLFVSRLIRFLSVGLRRGLRFITRLAGLLATSAQSSPADDELNSSVRGGVLNYRTGKLDDGTDPYGWYEKY